MKLPIFYLLIICSAILARANDYVESFNVISDQYEGSVHDVQVVRPINGGTVIIPEFDETCPEEMKAPFAYACKIMEEYMPPCLPLKIAVSCGRVNSSSGMSISKVRSNCKEDFGVISQYRNVPMSRIKGVIMAELGYNSRYTYFDSIPDMDFLTATPDISITYNSQKLEEMSFSLDLPDDDNEYDFVSVALRDIFIGLGLSHSYRYNPVTKELQNPSQLMTPFEMYLDHELGQSATPASRLAKATSGELQLRFDSRYSLRLYAPTVWTQGVSLNYFIPDSIYSVSQILSKDFGKGTVARSLSDNRVSDIFNKLLQWQGDFFVSTDSPTFSNGAGRTSDIMPYNGAFDIVFSSTGQMGTANHAVNAVNNAPARSTSLDNGKDEAIAYMEQFHPFRPFFVNGSYTPTLGIAVSILKKDGTWDVVKHELADIIITDDEPFNYSLQMSDLKFHCDDEEYARTIDGYLRARVSLVTDCQYQPITEYGCRYFVIDYKPQKIKLSYKRNVSSANGTSTRTASPRTLTSAPVRLYFSNLEGATRVVLERLRPGSRIPSKTEITNFRQGYYDTTVDRTAIFTAVAYNANGTSRSVPVEISPLFQLSGIKFRYEAEKIHVIMDEPRHAEKLDYSITRLASVNPGLVTTGTTTGTVDVSGLSDGMYMLTVDGDSCESPATFKFKK